MSGDTKSLKIGTHNGTFHCDEVLACFMLKQLPQYKDSEIVRSRDQAILDTCDIVVDVGGVYDPKKHRYDHHQRSFNESMSSLCDGKAWVTKLSSAGLVYLHFGRRLLAQIFELTAEDPIVETVYDLMYEGFIEEIDGVDNGVNQYDGEPRYKVTTTLSSRVRNLNPAWNETSFDEQGQFMKAMEMVGSVFLDRVLFYKNSWLPARSLVEEALNNRHKVDESGEIVCLSAGGCPWKEHLFQLEKSLDVSPTIKYMLYTDTAGKWRIQCVPVRPDSFSNRLSLPSDWQGLRDDELIKKSGIPGCIFVHANGFIGGNQTYEGVLAMAKYSLKQQIT
ncbi:MYG1 exonuclease-like isoform X2 [Mya arenaria]|nr:MYG1 exonuclease-like isoform X2 [Mya arenaria]